MIYRLIGDRGVRTMRRLNLSSPALSERHRKFAREVGSVVLGVLIALAIGEAADALRWQWRIGQAMIAIRSELSNNRFNLAERRIYQPCVEQRLKKIGQILQTARRTRALPTLGNIDRPGMRLMESYAYQVAISEGTPARMNPDRARELARFYGFFDTYLLVAREEADDWRRLSLLETAGGPVSDDLLVSLLEAWASASANAKLVGLMADQQDSSLKEFGIPIEYFVEIPNYAAVVSYARDSKCRPLIVDGQPYRVTG